MEVRRAHEGDMAAVLALLARCLSWEEDEHSATYFHWKHFENPFGQSPMWLAFEGDTLVGVRAWLRWRLTDGSRDMAAVRAVDTTTDPAHQGRGIFRTLTLTSLEELRESGIAMVFNTPNAASGTGYLTMGWEPVGRLPVAVRFHGLRGLRTALVRRVAADRWSLPCDVGVDARTLTDDSGLLARFPSLPGDGRLRTLLDDDFLRWRYGLPELRYRALIVGDALAFFRVRRRGIATECVIGHVLGVDARERSRAITMVAKHVRADRTIALDDSVGMTHGFARFAPVGPHLMWRGLNDMDRPLAGDWALSMGDVELL